MLNLLLKPIMGRLDKLEGAFAKLFLTESDRKRRGVVAVELPRSLVEGQSDWSLPVQMRFEQLPTGDWTIFVRDARVADHERIVAARAARQ